MRSASEGIPKWPWQELNTGPSTQSADLQIWSHGGAFVTPRCNLICTEVDLDHGTARMTAVSRSVVHTDYLAAYMQPGSQSTTTAQFPR